MILSLTTGRCSSSTEWAVEYHDKYGQKPELQMLEVYRGGAMDKFKIWADHFFRVGYGSADFRGAQSNMLLSDFLTVFDEAFIVAVVHNGFERWVQEAVILASGGIVDKKRLPKNKWTETGSSAKKYEGWDEEGVVFFNSQVEDLINLRLTTTPKMMEDIYLREKKDQVQESRRGPVKRSFQVTALNGLVDVEEVVVEEQTVPTSVVVNTGDGSGRSSNKRQKSQLGNNRTRRVSNGSDCTSQLTSSGASDQLSTEHGDSDDEEEEEESQYHDRVNRQRQMYAA